ncbi:hypothetical protein AS156_12540 [Bradyrhizobium macuxiense]|uniref:DUF2946 domain-containing protein n=1 Tax=Bradyrhizobium macuxiense TaxID=1755647 RepID=A0A109JM66_9BRAD|nr:hypothetical protein [Bradyrhizobium macuxiense]KWV51513.1 hypothetical protein AS156_12540 [Bradyrhizobium macuxiense]
MRAGCFIVLAYLFCVLAPSVSLALGAPFPCLTDEVQPVATVHRHEASVSMVGGSDAGHDHHGMHAQHAADAVTPLANHSHHHDGKSSPGPCCAMLCVPAMPADLPSVEGPRHPVATRISDAHRSLRSEAPARLYRPPIT